VKLAVPKGLTSTRLRLHLDESEILLGMSLERMLEDPNIGDFIKALAQSKLWGQTRQQLQSWIECLMMSVLWAGLKRTQSIEKPNFLRATSDQGSWDTFQPPPSAWINSTAEDIRRPRIWIAVTSLLSTAS
jgi:hypothetical protein